MNANRLVLSCFLVFLYLVRLSESYFVLVDADAEECFFDKAENGVKMSRKLESVAKNRFLMALLFSLPISSLPGLMFETIEGGFYDIDVKINGPDGKPIHQGEKETSGKYTFAAYMTGTYTYCFSNKMSSMTPKVVMFTMDIGDAPTGTMGAVKEDEVGHTKLEEMIRELSGTLTSIKHEQEYMHVS